MSDIRGLEDFSTGTGNMLVFDLEGEKYSIKLRASAYRSVLRAKPELKSYPISPEDRRAFIGKGGDGKGEVNDMLFMVIIEVTYKMYSARRVILSKSFLAIIIGKIP